MSRFTPRPGASCRRPSISPRKRWSGAWARAGSAPSSTREPAASQAGPPPRAGPTPRLCDRVGALVKAHGPPPPLHGPQRLAFAVHVAGPEGGGEVEDGLARALVLPQAKAPRAREVVLEVQDVVDVGPPPRVDR